MKTSELFDSTLQKTHSWIADVKQELQISNDHVAYLTLRAVIQTLRDQLSPNDAAQFAAQLPTLIRGIFFESWDPGHGRAHTQDAFLHEVMGRFGQHPTPHVNTKEMVAAVLRVLHRRTGHEFDQILGCLPENVRALYVAPAAC